MNFMERFSPTKVAYKDLPADEKSNDGEDSDLLQGNQSRYPLRRTFWSLLFPYATTAALVVALFTVTVLYVRAGQVTVSQATVPQERQKLECGNSLEEAKAAGCTFDMLSKSWLQPECPRFGTEEYIVASKDYGLPHWQYFMDADGSVEFDHQQLPFAVNNKPGQVWSWAGTDREHMVHCAWVIIRLAHAMKMGDRVDTLSADFTHTKHCTLQLLHKAMLAPDIDDISTRGDIVFATC